MPPWSWATMLTFLLAHLSLLVKGDVCTAAQGFDACRQETPVTFNPDGSGPGRQGIAAPIFNHLSEYHMSLLQSKAEVLFSSDPGWQLPCDRWAALRRVLQAAPWRWIQGPDL